MLNELYFANMRKEYVTMKLSSDTRLRSDFATSEIYKRNDSKNAELIALQQELSMVENTTDLMLNLLDHYRVMYHSCVSINAYEEDIHYFWQRTNKLYTPMHQNSYLFQDRQEVTN